MEVRIIKLNNPHFFFKNLLKNQFATCNLMVIYDPFKSVKNI